MQVVTLAEVKTHLRVTSTSEDALITSYITAIETHVANYLNQAIPGLDVSPIDVPAPIKSAIFLLVGDLYENRQAQVSGTELYANKSAYNLLYPYRCEIGM